MLGRAKPRKPILNLDDTIDTETDPAVQPAFRGKIIDVGVERVRLPNGRHVELEVIRHPGGAAAVALDDRRRVCLLRQYRYVAGGWLWELPAGKLDPGEGPAMTAERELAEEAGLVAATWDSLGCMHSSPGVFAEVIHLFLARGLSEVDLGHGADEVIEVHWVPLDKVLQWCLNGTITDAKTLVGLYRAAAFLRGGSESLAEQPLLSVGA
jgi:ADP-ribose pyrophosphatase